MNQKERDLKSLEDILFSIELIFKYINNVTKQDFYESQEKQDLVSYRLQVIGEAAKRISNDLTEKYPNLPWREMKGMRDILIHQYDKIIIEILWETVKDRLPEVESEIRRIYNDMSEF